MDDIAKLRADLEQTRIELSALRGTTISILHVIVQAVETVGIDRERVADSLMASVKAAWMQDQDKAQSMACDLIAVFAQSTLARPSPPPRPALHAIDGGKP